MSEKYNKYHESLNIDCCDKEINKPKAKNNCCCDGVNLPSHNNEIEILIRQLKREVKELLQTTEARLLCQDKKISETMVYIKNNLSNYLRTLLDSMLVSGEIEKIIKDIILDDMDDLKQYLETLQEKYNQLESNVESNANNIENLRENQLQIGNTLSKYDEQISKNKQDINRNNSNIQTINNNIQNIETRKIEFENYEDQNINSKFQNIDISTDYANDSIIYITKIKNIEKLSVLPTNGNKTGDVYENRINVKEYASNNLNYDLYANAGMSGIYIFDGIVNNTTRLDCPYYVGFDANNEMHFYEGLSNEITPNQLINDGIVNCFSGFAPLIINHSIADYTSLENIASTNEIANAFIESLEVKHPRQILAQDDNNDFYIISIMGRFNNSQGFNYEEMQNYCYSLGFKNAFNCDGGGSMQTIYNNEYVFYPSQELDTNIDRAVPSVIAFKIMEVE